MCTRKVSAAGESPVENCSALTTRHLRALPEIRQFDFAEEALLYQLLSCFPTVAVNSPSLIRCRLSIIVVEGSSRALHEKSTSSYFPTTNTCERNRRIASKNFITFRRKRLKLGSHHSIMAPSLSLSVLARVNEIVTTPTTPPTHPTESSQSRIQGITEAWAQGFHVGAIIILILVTLCNYRKRVLLHKLILLEVSCHLHDYPSSCPTNAT